MAGGFDEARRILNETARKDLVPVQVEAIMSDVEAFIEKHDPRGDR
jgi:hypothetical protein